MILTEKEKKFIKKKKKLWDFFGWGYKGSGNGYFKRNHSLNDGCSLCKLKTFYKKYKHKKERVKFRNNLKNLEA